VCASADKDRECTKAQCYGRPRGFFPQRGKVYFLSKKRFQHKLEGILFMPVGYLNHLM
jgi:hypothetical protein